MARASATKLRSRAKLPGEILRETVERLRGDGSLAELQHLVDRFGNRERRPIVMTANLPGKLADHVAAAEQPRNRSKETGEFIRSKGVPVQAEALPVRRDGGVVGAVAISHNASYIGLHGSNI